MLMGRPPTNAKSIEKSIHDWLSLIHCPWCGTEATRILACIGFRRATVVGPGTGGIVAVDVAGGRCGARLDSQIWWRRGVSDGTAAGLASDKADRGGQPRSSEDGHEDGHSVRPLSAKLHAFHIPRRGVVETFVVALRARCPRPAEDRIAALCADRGCVELVGNCLTEHCLAGSAARRWTAERADEVSECLFLREKVMYGLCCSDKTFK